MCHCRATLMLVCLSLTTACGSASITYHKLGEALDVNSQSSDAPKTTSAVDPEIGEYVFALRSSSILFPAPEVKKKDDNKDTGGGGSAVSVNCPPASTLATCMWTMKPVAVPRSAPNATYAMRPSDGMTIQVVSSEADPLMLTSVSMNYKNPANETIQRVGTAAATGFAMAGVPGAVIVVVATEVESHRLTDHEFKYWQTPPKAPHVELDPNLWGEFKKKTSLICHGANKSLNDIVLPDTKTQSVLLPVVLDKSIPDSRNCWQQFPQSDEAFTNKGWFYRVIDPQKPASDMDAFPPVYDAKLAQSQWGATFTTPAALRTNRDVFPVSACRSVVLQVAWWESLATQVNEPPAAIEVLPWASNYNLTVADPDHLQVLKIGKAPRKFTVLSCGGFASQAQSSTAEDAAVDVFFKQAKDVRAAQKAWNKDHQ